MHIVLWVIAVILAAIGAGLTVTDNMDRDAKMFGAVICFGAAAILFYVGVEMVLK